MGQGSKARVSSTDSAQQKTSPQSSPGSFWGLHNTAVALILTIGLPILVLTFWAFFGGPPMEGLMGVYRATPAQSRVTMWSFIIMIIWLLATPVIWFKYWHYRRVWMARGKRWLLAVASGFIYSLLCYVVVYMFWNYVVMEVFWARWF